MISLLTGLAIGLVFGMPVGAAGIMSMQRTLSAGPATGFITGMGQPWQCACMVLSDCWPRPAFSDFLQLSKADCIRGSHIGCGDRGPQTLRLP